VTSSAASSARLRADESLVRRHTAQLRELAAGRGITELRFASAGRLLGRVSGDRDLFDVAEFEAAAIDLLRADVMLLSDAVLSNAHVSEDLRDARPL